jgi:hypothetical protein
MRILLLSPFLSTNVCIIVYLDLFFAGSTHLHGIRADKILSKSYTKCFCRYKRLKTTKIWISKKEFVLTPYNYFAWKEKIAIHLQTRGLYRLSLNIDTKPTPSIEKSKYLNRMDEALGTICSLICLDLLFHISSCKTPNEA